MMDQRRDDFVDWLATVTAVPWLSFAAEVPCLLTGALPAQVEDPELLGTFQDAIVLYAWKHIVDKYLSSPISKAVSFFTTYLDLMASAIPAQSYIQSYIGFKAPPSLFPDAAFHFPIHGGWPLIPDWMSAFQIKHFISPQADLIGDRSHHQRLVYCAGTSDSCGLGS
jgi:hypothetical protein